jgi:two-component system OmpR family sensor kinase
MLHSVRARLTLWYTGILALVLITFSAISYFLLAQATRSATDTSLLATLHETESSFAAASANPDAVRSDHYADRDVIILSSRGQYVAGSSPRLSKEDRDGVIRVAATGAKGFRTIAGGEEDDGVRLLAQPFDVKGTRYVAVVAQDLDPEADRLESAAQAVFLGIPLALVVAAAGGYLLARKSLAPVAAMSAKARQIGAETLDERITVHNERDELGHLGLTLNDLLERLQRAFTSQRRFMADASHELRTPLSIIQGEADVTLAREARSPDEYRESLEIIRKSARKLTHIVQNIFLLARSDAGTYPMQRSRFYLDDVLTESIRAMRTVASAKAIDLQCNSENELAMNGDEELVQRMVLNLVDNAVKFTPNGGRVVVSAGREDHTYIVRVADSGPSVSQDDRPHIFERFYRGDPARRSSPHGGAGLGLPIAQWIAQTHGGDVVLETGGAGNTFRVTLPMNE